ncbi:hypothetical protein DY000_02006806 [Brassica cretica]|uniref:Uncharacterized protein n=1 Tax=Brassica cretica TaxID=69181 RepID=A0ABQ7C1F8_BRACR|nr:hypothetical protein DY000_02006806 [Brassica cretica]
MGKEEKLQEGDFEVESLMSFGGSHWYRSTPATEHRSTYTNPNRSTRIPEHQSTTPTESTASCNAVKILTHEEFTAKHPHPSSPDNMSKIDVARLNALRSKPKPSEQPPKPVRTPSDDGDDPMEEDRVSTGRTLRRRKEKKPQTISRRINDAGIIAACHCGAEYESDNTESIYTHPVTSIDTNNTKSTATAYYKSVDTDFNRVRDGDYSIGSWADEHHHESFAVETVTYTPGADKLQDSFTDEELLNMQKRDDTDQLQAEAAWERTHSSQSIDTRHQQSIDKHPQQSIDTNNTTSIDNRPILKSNVSKKNKIDDEYLIPDECGIFRDPDGYARAINGRIMTTIRVHNKDIRRLLERASRDEPAYICLPEHASSFTQTKLVPEIYTKDEINEMFYGVCGEHDRNKEAFQMKLDGVYYPLNNSISWLTTFMEEMKKDIARIQNATGTARPPSIDRRQPQSIDSRQSPSLDRHHHTSIDNHLAASIDTNPPHPHTMKSQLNFNTREEIDQLIEGIFRALKTTEERLDGRCDDIYFPMDLTISALTSKVEAIQGELVEIQSYIACRPEASISIDRCNNKSIDTHNSTSIDSDTNRGQLVPKTTSDMSNTPYHGKEISTDTYAALTVHQFNLESLGERLQRIENTTAAMKDKWRRGDEALRDFTGAAFAGIVHFCGLFPEELRRNCERLRVGAVCNLQTNQLCLTLIDPNAHYDPIPVKKPQTISRRINDAGITAACHCGAEYESDYSESIDTHPITSIDTNHTKLTDADKEESVDDEYDEDLEEERAIEYRAILDEEDKLLHHSSWKRNTPSFDMTSFPSINTQPQQRCRKQASTDTAYYKSVDTDFNRVRDGD